MVKSQVIRGWVTTDLRKVMYELKAENPDKSLIELQNDVARIVRENKHKIRIKDGFWK